MAKSRFRVSIVIPVWNGWGFTETCLRSLAEHTPGDDFQVVLADNGSTDETPVAAPLLGRALFGDRFVHHRLPENLGFAKACNAGAKASSADLLFFLNNDTTVTQDWLPPLLAGLKAHPRRAGVGPLLLFPDDDTVRANRVQHLGIAVADGMDFRHLYEYFPHTHPAVARRRELSVITAAALLMPAPLFRAHEGFHEGFINGMEDVDLCCRVSSRGGNFSVVPESVIHHHTHGTEGRFDHESANLRLLRTRCRDAAENYCGLIRADGFEPGITPWLDLVARLPEARSLELDTRFKADPHVEHLFALIDEEPLWDRGYALLSSLLEESGLLQDAMPVAYFRSLLCPSLAAYEECVRIVRACGVHDMADRYEAMLHSLKRAMADRDKCNRKARTLLHAAKDPAVRTALKQYIAG